MKKKKNMNTKMAINTYISIIESKKQNKQAEQKQNLRFREHLDGYQMGGGSEGWAKKVKGLRSTIWQLQNSHGDVKYSIVNRVANIQAGPMDMDNDAHIIT